MLKFSRSIRRIQSSAHAPPRRRTRQPTPPASPGINAAPAPAAHPPRIRLKQRPVTSPSSSSSSPTSPIKSTVAFTSQKSLLKRSQPKVAATGDADDFSGALYTLKALAIATAIVAASAAASIAGVMTWMGVNDIAEFSERTRTWVASVMPVLSTQIHRRLTPTDNTHSRRSASQPAPPNTLLPPPPSAHVTTETLHPSTTFNHEASQDRLAAAYDKGGFYAWLETATKEMEAEAEVERARTARSRGEEEQRNAKR
ncbi:hypothetical protein F5I97DRAFT_1867460 [Phlebopus sp. FC_14]|nr:hypothetical protein F5I97DRAFT_1867460 [Phlebopus sp. FC_14]